MRNHWGLWLLLLFSISGCAAGRSNVVAARPIRSPVIQPAVTRPPVIRAESERLSELGEAARERPAPEAKPSRKRDSHCSTCDSCPCKCDNENSLTGQLLAPIVFGAIAAPFVLPCAMVGDEYVLEADFPAYPYADDFPGSLILTSPYEPDRQSWTGTLQLFGVQETHNIDRYGGRLVLDSASRFGLDTEANAWIENSSSQLWTGDVNLVYRFAQSEKVQFHAGVGVNWLGDTHGAEAGFNLTYGVDWYPRRPWTISTVFDVGKLGGGTLFHNRTTAGVMMGPVEAFAGYDYFQLGSVNFHGPVAGLALHF